MLFDSKVEGWVTNESSVTFHIFLQRHYLREQRAKYMAERALFLDPIMP